MSKRQFTPKQIKWAVSRRGGRVSPYKNGYLVTLIADGEDGDWLEGTLRYHRVSSGLLEEDSWHHWVWGPELAASESETVKAVTSREREMLRDKHPQVSRRLEQEHDRFLDMLIHKTRPS